MHPIPPRAVRAAILGALLTLPLGAQGAPTPRDDRWWGAIAAGYGSLRLEDRLGDVTTHGTFALHFSGGYALSPRLRVGLTLGGWLLEAFDLNDPSTGRAVSHFGAIVEAQPFATVPLVLSGGSGSTAFTARAPGASDTDGWMWTAGLGYAAVRRGRWRVVPGVHVAGGRYGRPDVPGLASARAYQVVEARVAGAFTWGARR